ncbi:cytochrome c [Chitinophagaceae bacterium LB-8]|uniref:Cytochrome c n=1 Tax=Paraflavisolibacter caeni TaxID=2982496 RepID=A0A9X2XPV6_9BACT|nr:cytochrome c [Paraflavisolibacter caeni]MCU7551924.1 cytochrome c [Paraflavisolibacter caeni]
MKKTLLVASALFCMGSLFVVSCGNNAGNKSAEDTTVDVTKLTQSENEVHGTKIEPGEIQLTTPLNPDMVSGGKGIYEMKCQSCHRLNEERLVGPGWKGVTKRRTPDWIMNMITNVDMMLESDPEAQKLLELCLVRMPNQNLTKEDARKVLEYMRNNDGEK